MNDLNIPAPIVSHTLIPGVLELVPPCAPAVPVVMDSPHSGRDYPDDFQHCMSPLGLRGLEDAFVDELFGHAPGQGATLLKALFPRSYIDPNRSHDDIDERMLEDDWPHDSNPSYKARSGIGLIFRYAAEGPVYDRKLKASEVRRRLDRYYWPYHQTLGEVLDAKWRHFGRVFHINCHSMKSVSPGPAPEGKGAIRPHFVLGDRDGTSCDGEFTRLVREFLSDHGYSVTVNDPYKGVELVRRYSNPSQQRHSLQIEINRALYMDEEKVERGGNFETVRKLLRDLTNIVCSYVRD